MLLSKTIGHVVEYSRKGVGWITYSRANPPYTLALAEDLVKSEIKKDPNLIGRLRVVRETTIREVITMVEVEDKGC